MNIVYFILHTKVKLIPAVNLELIHFFKHYKLILHKSSFIYTFLNIYVYIKLDLKNVFDVSVSLSISFSVYLTHPLSFFSLLFLSISRHFISLSLCLLLSPQSSLSLLYPLFLSQCFFPSHSPCPVPLTN